MLEIPLPVRVLLEKCPLFCLEFICAQVRRHADATVFNENAPFESALWLPRPACAEDFVIAVMINLGKALPDCAFLCLFPRSCHKESIG